MPNAWPTAVDVDAATRMEARSDDDGTTFQLTHDGRQVRVRFHRDGTIRLAGTTKGDEWTFEPAGRPGDRVPNEYGYPVVRVRPQPA
jgi:hypothetical protein